MDRFRLLEVITLRGSEKETVLRAKRHLRSWCVLNSGVIAIPILLRALLAWFVPDLTDMRILRLEEVHFFSLFVMASSLVDLWEHRKSSGPVLESVGDRQFWLLILFVILMAGIYGFAFSGMARIDVARGTVLILLMAFGVIMAVLTEALLVREAYGLGSVE